MPATSALSGAAPAAKASKLFTIAVGIITFFASIGVNLVVQARFENEKVRAAEISNQVKTLAAANSQAIVAVGSFNNNTMDNMRVDEQHRQETQKILLDVQAQINELERVAPTTELKVQIHQYALQIAKLSVEIQSTKDVKDLDPIFSTFKTVLALQTDIASKLDKNSAISVVNIAK